MGAAMVALLLGMLYADHWLEQVDVSNTAFQAVLGDAAHPPGGLVILAMLIVMIALAGGELAQMARAKGVIADRWTLALAGTVGVVSVHAIALTLSGAEATAAHGSVAGAVLALALLRHAWGGNTQGVTVAAALALLALVYLGALPGFYLLMRQEHAAGVVAAAALVIKSCDIGAYFTGRTIGRHKLIPWLSPGKTWEGLIGGVTLAAVLAVALAAASNYFGWAGRWTGQGSERIFEPMQYSLVWAVIGGVVLAVAGQLGDLAASLLKRDAGVKDSGSTIPGFGGVLDVMDSLILAAPLAYWLTLLAVV